MPLTRGFSPTAVFIVDERNEHFSTDSTGKMLLSKDGSYLVAYPSASGTISLPDSITHIGDNVFCNSELKEISIPHSVVYIGDIAFAECNSLKEVSIPNSVTHIGDGAFLGPATCRKSQSPTASTISETKHLVLATHSQHFHCQKVLHILEKKPLLDAAH
ncbi:MAG: leucine-rich repeat domain-containing protein [Spirochaetaceae bacterium]|nr:leucine-rich repeat domain-containing protein [Spirochaetaceae bacterium]